jgi:hypothetical protein
MRKNGECSDCTDTAIKIFMNKRTNRSNKYNNRSKAPVVLTPARAFPNLLISATD